MTGRRRPFAAIDVLLGVLTFVVAMLWAGRMAGSEAEDAVAAAWVYGALAGLVVAGPPHVVVHELGHLGAARALRLRVTGFRVWGLQLGTGSRVPGASGQVDVDFADAGRWVPARMSLVSLAGPAANLLLAAGAAAVVALPSAPTWLRGLCVGIAVLGAAVGFGNLLPRRISPLRYSDGRRVLDWLLHPAAARERVRLADDLARLRTAPSSQDHEHAYDAADDRQAQRAGVDDPRPQVATAALVQLLTARSPSDDAWQDCDLVARYAARLDVAAATRAALAGSYALWLCRVYLTSLDAGEHTDPTTPRVQQIDRLVAHAVAAHRESLVARTALGLVRVIQDRPAETRAALLDIDPRAEPGAQATAYTVRGIAEAELGDTSQAVSLGLIARRLAPREPLIDVLEWAVAAQAPGQATTDPV